MKRFVIISPLVVMLLSGCGEQGSDGDSASTSISSPVVAIHVDTPSEVTEKFIKAFIVDKDYDEVITLSTPDLADTLRYAQSRGQLTSPPITDVQVRVINEEIEPSPKMVNGKPNGGRATVRVSMSGKANGQIMNGGHEYYLRQVDGQWLMNKF